MTAARIIRTPLLLLLSGYAVACAAVTSPDHRAILFPRAAIGVQDVEKAIVFEAELEKRYDQAPPAGVEWFEVLEGNAPVIISAPHATTPTREGDSHEFADAGTGSLAVALHRLTGATVIYTTYKSPSDPNFYDDNDYKKRLAELLVSKKPLLVLDLHTSHWNRPYDVDFGTMGGESLLGEVSLLRVLSDQLRSEGLTNFSQDYFAASRSATVTKWVSARGVPCIQLEISATWTVTAGPALDVKPNVDPEDQLSAHLSAHRFAQLLEGLTQFLRSVAPSPGP